MATYPSTGKTGNDHGFTDSMCPSIIANATDSGSLASLTSKASVLLIAIAWLVIGIPLSAVAQERERKVSAEIHKWIDQLGSPIFEVREAATKRLLQAGQEGVAPLKLALADRDRERVGRARVILAAILNKLDLEALQGKWKYVSVQLSGKTVKPGSLLIIQGGKMTIRKGDGTEPYGAMIFSIDAAQMPKHLDFADGESGIKGLYRVEGDTLTLCYPYDRNNPRPKKIGTTAGDGMRLHELTRVTR